MIFNQLSQFTYHLVISVVIIHEPLRIYENCFDSIFSFTPLYISIPQSYQAHFADFQ